MFDLELAADKMATQRRTVVKAKDCAYNMIAGADVIFLLFIYLIRPNSAQSLDW